MLHFKGMTIGALGNGRVLLMRNDFNLFQRAKVLVFAVVLALIDRAFDAHVCITIFHNIPSLIYIWDDVPETSMYKERAFYSSSVIGSTSSKSVTVSSDFSKRESNQLPIMREMIPLMLSSSVERT